MDAASRVVVRKKLPVRGAARYRSPIQTGTAATKWKIPAVTSAAGLLQLPAVDSNVRSPGQGMAGLAAPPSCLPAGSGACGNVAASAGREVVQSPPPFIVVPAATN
jgi:hypothetical protein